MASRNTLSGWTDFRRNRCWGNPSPLPPLLPSSFLGVQVLIFYLSSFSHVDRNFLSFHQILSPAIWQMLILPHPPTCLMWNHNSLLCVRKKLPTFIILQTLWVEQCLDIRAQHLAAARRQSQRNSLCCPSQRQEAHLCFQGNEAIPQRWWGCSGNKAQVSSQVRWTSLCTRHPPNPSASNKAGISFLLF